MNVVIVEDELAASEHLSFMLAALDADIQILQTLDSVRAAVSFFKGQPDADLVFMDIHLADGLSFEIFEQVRVGAPVIFTTAYDQYALKAFKVNSIDYLLKPVDEAELARALEEFRVERGLGAPGTEAGGADDRDADNQAAGQPGSDTKGTSRERMPRADTMNKVLEMLRKDLRSYKSTFLVAHRDQLIPLKTDRIAYFHIDTGIVKAVNFDRDSYVVDSKLEEIEAQLNPADFHRVNRQFIVNREAIANIKFYFNGKLLLEVSPPAGERIVVSKAKAGEFKDWMNS